MDALRRRWWVPLVALAVCGAAIYVVAPHYVDAQTAADTDAFRLAVGDPGPGRTSAAAILDMAFVVAYVVLAVALTRRHVATRVGAGLVALGAVADVVENSLVLVGVGQGDDVAESTVDAIGSFGAVKWAGVIVGALVMLVGLVLQPRAQPSG